MESWLYDASRMREERIRLQRRLDKAKTHQERNRLGQFATPPELAREILQVSKMYREEGKPVSFLEPGFGTGAFLAALAEVFSADGIKTMRGVEIDPHYGEPARQLWEKTSLDLVVGDFTQLHAPNNERDKANLLVCNPPYVRHHYLGVAQKRMLQEQAQQVTGIRLNGLAGLYCYGHACPPLLSADFAQLAVAKWRELLADSKRVFRCQLWPRGETIPAF